MIWAKGVTDLILKRVQFQMPTLDFYGLKVLGLKILFAQLAALRSLF